MRQIRHPLSGAIYELDDGDAILVSQDGATGRFTPDGRWLDGDIRSADPELCRWIGSGYRGRGTAHRQPPVQPPSGRDHDGR